MTGLPDPAPGGTTRRRRPYAARMPREERREQILDAALRVIRRDGYERVSIESIGREAGVTRPVVYGAFDGLGALLTSLLDRQQVRALSQLLQALPEDLADDPLTVVESAASALVVQIGADPDTWEPILLAPHGTPAEVRDRIDADRELVRSRVADLIAGVLPDADHEVLSHAVIGVLEHFGALVLREPERFGADRLRTSVRLVLAPLLTSRGGRPAG